MCAFLGLGHIFLPTQIRSIQFRFYVKNCRSTAPVTVNTVSTSCDSRLSGLVHVTWLMTWPCLVSGLYYLMSHFTKVYRNGMTIMPLSVDNQLVIGHAFILP